MRGSVELNFSLSHCLMRRSILGWNFGYCFFCCLVGCMSCLCVADDWVEVFVVSMLVIWMQQKVKIIALSGTCKVISLLSLVCVFRCGVVFGCVLLFRFGVGVGCVLVILIFKVINEKCVDCSPCGVLLFFRTEDYVWRGECVVLCLLWDVSVLFCVV